MHHAENNLKDDESSTMPFQRDSVKDFGIYFGKFLFRGVFDLLQYFSRKKRKRLLYRSLRGELLFILFCVAMSFVSFKATLWVFVIPMFIYRLVSMMGNWAQHSFIDSTSPGNEYKNSITCINTKYNLKCWNDGYHISHHEKQTMHWTEHPAYFQKTLEKYKANDSIVFDGIHFLHVFFWLMRKRYDLLAINFVNLNGKYHNNKEVEIFLRSRTRKIVED
jgi:fatty acid desaturase